MTISSTNSLAPNVVSTPIDAPPTDSATHTQVKRVSIVNERSPSSSYAITVIHPPQDPSPLCPLLEEGSVAPANSEVVLNEEEPPSEIPVEETQNIFNRVFCCCRK